MASIECRVTGMTCSGCAAAVYAAVAAVDGVSQVSVNITTGEVRVRSDRDVRAAVYRAIADAGYVISR